MVRAFFVIPVSVVIVFIPHGSAVFIATIIIWFLIGTAVPVGVGAGTLINPLPVAFLRLVSVPDVKLLKHSIAGRTSYFPPLFQQKRVLFCRFNGGQMRCLARTCFLERHKFTAQSFCVIKVEFWFTVISVCSDTNIYIA